MHENETTHAAPRLIWVSVYDAGVVCLFWPIVLWTQCGRKHMWNSFIFISNTPVTNCTDCSHRYLNVIFHYSPPVEGSNIFILLFISLCKQSCVRGISLFLDVRVQFSFMPRFPETNTKNDTLTVRSQTVRAEQWRHLWWNKLKSLWCCASLWDWFQLLCAFQGRHPTASPTKFEMAPVHLPYS